MMTHMIHSLNKQFSLFIALGAVIILIAAVITIADAGQAATYLTAATADQGMGDQPVGVTGAAIWLPAFKFLGITLVLSGVVMAQDVLCMRLPAIRPRVANLVAPCMALGLVLVTAGFIVALYVAGVVSGTIIDLEVTSGIQTFAAAGSASTWLEGLQLAGTALMVLAAAGSLHTLSYMLRHQHITPEHTIAGQVFGSTALTDWSYKEK